MRKRLVSWPVAAFAGLMALGAAPAFADPAILQLSATADVQAAPDIAEIGAGVVTIAPEAAAAMAANSAAMNKAIAALKAAGIAARDIRTSGLGLQPQFRYEQNREPVLTGFRASNRVQVTIRRVADSGKVLDALVKAGANQIDGPNFRIADPEPLLDQARQKAVAMARQRAQLYASAAGLKVKRIAMISEGSASVPPMPMPRMMMVQSASADAAPPVEIGESTLSVTVSVRFELE